MSLDEASAVLTDHVLGLHDDFDHPDGCQYPSCEDAWWMITAADELTS